MTLEMTGGSSLVWEHNLLSSIDNRNEKQLVLYDNTQPALATEITRFVDAAAGRDPELPASGSFAAKVLRLLESLREIK